MQKIHPLFLYRLFRLEMTHRLLTDFHQSGPAHLRVEAYQDLPVERPHPHPPYLIHIRGLKLSQRQITPHHSLVRSSRLCSVCAGRRYSRFLSLPQKATGYPILVSLNARPNSNVLACYIFCELEMLYGILR